MTSLKLPTEYYWLWSLDDLTRYAEYVSDITNTKKSDASRDNTGTDTEVISLDGD